MLSRLARAGRLESGLRCRARLLAPVPAGLVGLALALSGCGGSGGPDTGVTSSEASVRAAAEPDAATRGCRREWRDLGEEISGRDSSAHPSTLPQRWTNVAATVSYYEAAATEDDCGPTLAAQEEAIAALTAFVRSLAPYDMERRLNLVREDARDYAAGPRPPAPDSGDAATKKGKQRAARKPLPRPPAPKEVAAALRTLTRQAPRATDDQRPAWRQAQVVDLADRAAVQKAVKDLAFLSRESRAHRAARTSLATIREALGAGG